MQTHQYWEASWYLLVLYFVQLVTPLRYNNLDEITTLKLTSEICVFGPKALKCFYKFRSTFLDDLAQILVLPSGYETEQALEHALKEMKDCVIHIHGNETRDVLVSYIYKPASVPVNCSNELDKYISENHISRPGGAKTLVSEHSTEGESTSFLKPLSGVTTELTKERQVSKTSLPLGEDEFVQLLASHARIVKNIDSEDPITSRSWHSVFNVSQPIIKSNASVKVEKSAVSTASPLGTKSAYMLYLTFFLSLSVDLAVIYSDVSV